MMGWGQVYVNSGAGSTDQIERAHEALDRLEIAPGPLAVRVLALIGAFECGTYRRMERCGERMSGFPRCGSGSVEHECVADSAFTHRHQCSCGATWAHVPDDEGSGGVR